MSYDEGRVDPTVAEPFDAYHIGRMGEVAGGMTQVMNSYLQGPFLHARIHVIKSRDGSKGLRSFALYARAVINVLRVPRRPSTVFVVHLSQGGSFVREGSLLRMASARGFATVAQLHGSSFASYSEHYPGMVRRTLGSADIIHALSAETEAAVHALLPDANTTIVPNAVADGKQTPKTKSIVFGGSVSLRKGVDVLLEAWKKLRRTEGWELLVAGPVVLGEIEVEDIDGVVFLGGIPHDELMSLLDASRIAVLPSRDEAMPMFILEAMARGNCVVSTFVGGIPAVLGKGVGVLTQPGNVDDLANELQLLLDDDDRIRQFGVRAKDTFEYQYSASAVFPTLEMLWRDAGRLRNDRKSAKPKRKRKSNAAANGTEKSR